MTHNLTLKACEDMLKDLENQMIELDQKKQRLQIIIDKKRIQCGNSKSKSVSRLTKSKTKSKTKSNSRSKLSSRRSQSIKPSIPIQSQNFTSKGWDEHMAIPENKKQFQLSQINTLPVKDPEYWVDNNVNKVDLKRYMVDKKIPENMLHEMIEKFKTFSETAPRNKKGNITGYHKTNGILNNAYKYFKKQYPQHPVFNNMTTGRM